MDLCTQRGDNKTESRIHSNQLNRGVPIIAVIGIGYGITALRDAQQRIQRESIQEEERLRRNAQLMEAYGDKTSLEDMQRALEHYHKVRIFPFPSVHRPDNNLTGGSLTSGLFHIPTELRRALSELELTF